MHEHIGYLSLGANLGDPRTTIASALDHLSAGGAPVVARSSDYQTPPWGKLDQPPFVNACAKVITDLTALRLLRLCLSVEASLGRVRAEKWGPRVIDIDLLAYDAEIVDTPELTLPHRFMLERAFVLVPLLEIAPDLQIAGHKIREVAGTLSSDGIRRLPPITRSSGDHR